VPYDDIIVAMNADTFQKDLSYLPEGGVVFYADHLQKPADARTDLVYYPMPIKQFFRQARDSQKSARIHGKHGIRRYCRAGLWVFRWRILNTPWENTLAAGKTHLSPIRT
jgi:hypothetical protein